MNWACIQQLHKMNHLILSSKSVNIYVVQDTLEQIYSTAHP